MFDFKKITNKKVLYIFTLSILIMIPFFKNLSYFLERISLLNNYDSINPAIVLYISIPFLIFIYLYNIIKNKRELDIYDYLFYIIIIVGIIVSIFAINPRISFFGKSYRREGFLSLLGYYLLFINWKVEGNKEDIKKILKIIVIIAVINSIYALLQVYTPFNFILRYAPAGYIASGLCGNPNFFGSLIVTAIGLVSAYHLINKKITIKNIIVLILLYISLINSQSTGPFIAYVVTLVFLLVYLLIKKKLILKNLVCLVLLFILVFYPIKFINSKAFSNKRCEICDFTNTVIGNEEEITSGYSPTTKRLTIWKNSLAIAFNNPIIGVGYDNLHYEYHKDIEFDKIVVEIGGQEETKEDINESSKVTKIVDNAHNVYLHTFATSGLLGLIPYLLLCLLVFIKGLKTKDNLKIILLGGFVSYSVQAFGNISVIQVAPIYYIIMGLLLSNDYNKA